MIRFTTLRDEQDYILHFILPSYNPFQFRYRTPLLILHFKITMNALLENICNSTLWVSLLLYILKECFEN